MESELETDRGESIPTQKSRFRRPIIESVRHTFFPTRFPTQTPVAISPQPPSHVSFQRKLGDAKCWWFSEYLKIWARMGKQ